MKLNFLFNPVALKELRQLVRSRVITIGIILYPIVLTLITALAVSSEMHDRSPQDIAFGPGLGETPFYVTSVIAGIIVCAGLPLFSAFKTCLEAQKERMGLEFITTLTPTDIVSGKILATALLMLIALGLSMPFFTLAYLMRGIPLIQAFTMPTALFIAGLVSLSLLMIIACNKSWAPALRIIAGIVAFGFMISFLVVIIGFISFASHRSPHGLSSPLAIAVAVVAGALALLLISRAACAALLSAPHHDSMRSLRKTELLIFLLSPLYLLLPGSLEAWIVITAVFALIICLRAAFHPHPIPRVANRTAPRSFIGRFLSFPLTTGSVPGLVFGLRILACSYLVLLLFSHEFRDDTSQIAFFAAFAELISLAIITGAVLRRCHASLRTYRITVSVAIVLFLFVNSAGILHEFDICSRSAFDFLPCSLHGIILDQVAWHGFHAAVLFIIAQIILIRSYIKAFRAYRRPQ